MFRATTLLTTMLALGVAASPTPPAGQDACGPTVQVAGDPKDSCAGKPDVVTTPSSFGDNGFVDYQPNGYNGWLSEISGAYEDCKKAIPEVCRMMTSNPQKDTWQINDGTSRDGGPSLGRIQYQFNYWLPSGLQAAPVPTTEQCVATFQTMLDHSRERNWYAATINLAVNPGPEYISTRYQNVELPDGSGTGQAVNSGYPSYVFLIGGNPRKPDFK